MTSTSRTARCGPACRVVWEGSVRKLTAPIPIADRSFRAFVIVWVIQYTRGCFGIEHDASQTPPGGGLRPRDGTMKAQDLLVSIALLPLLAMEARAQDIYKCDIDGRVTYSNVPTRNCRRLVLDPVNIAPAPKAARKATPGDFPKVDDQTQKSRDTDRRRILESELAAEQKNVEQARKALRSWHAKGAGR